MKLLIYQWNSYLQYDIYEICQAKKIDFVVFEWNFTDKNKDEAFARWFDENISAGEYDALLSVNYYPMMSEVCMKIGLKYIAWCYDTPLNVRRIEETLHNPVNYVFLFDRVQYMQYAGAGFETVWHLPLGVNHIRSNALRLSEQDRKKYGAEAAFVGRLYQSQVQELLSCMSDYTKGLLEAVMKVQEQIYGSFLIDRVVTQQLVEEINAQYRRIVPDTRLQLIKPQLVQVMSEEVTRRERLRLLNLCGRSFQTKLYSHDSDAGLENVQECGGVDCVLEAPKVYACSKVNLNISLKIIQTGIPLRAFEIMGAGGFLLSNYQEELLEHYENEKELVIYESPEDAVEKIRFYLAHETLRSRIAENGKRKTLEQHSLWQRMQTIFEVAGLL